MLWTCIADALVYAIGLYAVGKSDLIKVRAAHFGGVFQIILALGANVWCLLLIARFRNGEVHMRASWIFSKNDVIANVGVILGGSLVFLLDSHLPDLLVGCAIALIVIRGGIAIIKDAAKEKAQIVEL